MKLPKISISTKQVSNPLVEPIKEHRVLVRPGMIKDPDRDGVPNIIDCAPHNPNKQGIFHEASKWAATKVGETKTKWAARRDVALHKVRSDEDAPKEHRQIYEETVEEALQKKAYKKVEKETYAKAMHEEKVKSLQRKAKQRYTPKPSSSPSFFKGIGETKSITTSPTSLVSTKKVGPSPIESAYKKWGVMGSGSYYGAPTTHAPKIVKRRKHHKKRGKKRSKGVGKTITLKLN